MLNIPGYGLSAHHFNLARGNAGIIQTVRAMRALSDQAKCDPVIRQTALNVIGFLPQKDHEGEARTLFNFVRDQIRYVMDIEGVETLNTPVHTLVCGQGDCDDKSTLLAALLETVGFTALFKLAAYSPGDYEHVYVICVLPNGRQIPMDATEPQEMGYEPPGAVRTMLFD